MAKLIILCLAGLVACDAGLIPHPHSEHFPHLNTVYHGHGATSYQNFQVDNYGSVPIPKDLQVDDGHEYYHSQYLHDDVDVGHDVPSGGLENYEQPVVNDYIEDPPIFAHNVEKEEHVELEHRHHYAPDHNENYDHEAEYEYH